MSGPDVACIDPDRSTPLAEYLNHGKTTVPGHSAAAHDTLGVANLIVCEGNPAELRACQRDVAGIRRFNAAAALVLISPFGQTGPQADDPASDLTLLFRQRPCLAERRNQHECCGRIEPANSATSRWHARSSAGFPSQTIRLATPSVSCAAAGGGPALSSCRG